MAMSFPIVSSRNRSWTRDAHITASPEAVAAARAAPPFFFEAAVGDVMMRTTSRSQVALYNVSERFFGEYLDSLYFVAGCLDKPFTHTFPYSSWTHDADECASFLEEIRALRAPLRSVFEDSVVGLRDILGEDDGLSGACFMTYPQDKERDQAGRPSSRTHFIKHLVFHGPVFEHITEELENAFAIAAASPCGCLAIRRPLWE